MIPKPAGGVRAKDVLISEHLGMAFPLFRLIEIEHIKT